MLNVNSPYCRPISCHFYYEDQLQITLSLMLETFLFLSKMYSTVKFQKLWKHMMCILSSMCFFTSVVPHMICNKQDIEDKHYKNLNIECIEQ